VYFHSAVAHDLEQEAAHKDWRLPYNFSYSRKAAYQYGWDWGPRLVTAGIWKDVMLQCYERIRIDEAYMRTLSIDGDTAVV
jgi:beta-mannosidase